LEHPPKEDGSADLRAVEEVTKEIARYMNGYKVIVVKSTVLWEPAGV